MSQSNDVLKWVGLFALYFFSTSSLLAGSGDSPSPRSRAEIEARVLEQLQGIDPRVAGVRGKSHTKSTSWQPALRRDLFTSFDADGLRLSGADSTGEAWELGLELVALGRRGAMSPVPEGTLRETRHRSEVDRGVLEESVTGSGGTLIHGFVLSQPPYQDVDGPGGEPAEAGTGDLIFEVELSGNFTIERAMATEALLLRHGQEQFQYHHLSATDASGRQLPTHLDRSGSVVRLWVDDTAAIYPLETLIELTEVKKLFQPTAGIEEHAGWSVDIDGDTAVVGARFGDAFAVANAGRVYIFQRNQGGAENWGLVKELFLAIPEAQINAWLGWSVAISGDVLAVGAKSFSDFLIPFSGRVYLFERDEGGFDNWGMIKIVANPTPSLLDNFGNAVDLDGDTLVVGAEFVDLPPITSNSGEAYIFQRDQGGFNNWGLVQTLEPPTQEIDNLFGSSVAIDADTVVVGEPGNDGGLFGPGAVHVFERDQGGPNTWGPVTQIIASDGAAGDRFGISVAIDGDTIVVGADLDDGSVFDSGSAYVFERNLGGPNFWGRSAKLVASDETPGDRFGFAVDIVGDRVLVGAHEDESPLLTAGSAYFFERDEGGPGAWGESIKFTPDDLTPGDNFGVAVAMSGRTVLVGSFLDSDVAFQAGSAYIFEIDDNADLSISMDDSPDPVAAGQLLTYTITVRNEGPDPAEDVQVSHTLPAGVGGPATTGCAEDGAWVATCSLGDLASGATVQYTVEVTVDGGAAGILAHAATVASATGDPISNNNTANQTTSVGGGGGGSANLQLLKLDSADPVSVGDTLTYTLQVLNNGPDQAMDVSVAENLPAGVELIRTMGCAEDPTGIPGCSLGNILPGTSRGYTVEVTVTGAAASPLVNTATVSASTDDPVPGNNTTTETTAIGIASADVQVAIEDTPDPVNAGDPLTYTVLVFNSGPDPAPGTMVSLSLPPSVTGAMSTGCPEDPAGAAGCTLGEIAPNSTEQFTVTVQTDPGVVELLTVSATVTSEADDPNTTNNTRSETTSIEAPGEADLFVFQTDSVDPVDAGDPLSYTIVVVNRGPSTARGVQLTTQVGDSVNNPSASGCVSGGVPICELGDLTPGQNQVVTVNVQVGPDANGTLVNEVSVSSANPDPDPASASARETTTVIGVPGMANLLISVEDTPDPATPGETLRYTMTVINLGPNQAEEVVAESTLPATLSGLMWTGCLTDPGPTARCSLGTLDLGQVAMFSVEGTLDVGATGLQSFSTTVTSITEDPIPGNNENSETTDLNPVALADLSLTIADDGEPVAPGNAAVYTLTLENGGPAEATGVVIDTTVDGTIGPGPVMTTGCAEDPVGFPTCTVGTIGAGNLVGGPPTITIEIPIPEDTAEESITTTVAVSSETGDPEPGNDSMSRTTMIDGEPPVVENLTSFGDTGGGSLDECEEARVQINQLLVTFDQAMNDPAGNDDPTDVTNPDAYQLVAPGPDNRLTTTECGEAEDDDLVVPIADVTYDADSRTATLDFGSPLKNGPYRFLACGDGAADSSGTGLDGDADGETGGDFSRYFRIDTRNLFANGHFDCDLEGWSRVATTDVEITYSAFDVDSALESGAAVIFQAGATEVFSLGRCIDLPGVGKYAATGSFWLRELGTGDSLEITQLCEFYSEAGCSGDPLGDDSTVEEFDTNTATWETLPRWSFEPLPGAASAICSYDLRLTQDGNELTILLDDLEITNEVFRDNFESGDLSSWTTSSEN